MIINKDTGTNILAKLDKAQIMKLARLSRRIRVKFSLLTETLLLLAVGSAILL
jgi:hypothetical protein